MYYKHVRIRIFVLPYTLTVIIVNTYTDTKILRKKIIVMNLNINV